MTCARYRNSKTDLPGVGPGLLAIRGQSRHNRYLRSGVRVVEGARLEIAYSVLSRVVGSNPTRSARLPALPYRPAPLRARRENHETG